MNIVTPLTNAESYETLAEAGADEFYCGYVPGEWLKKYSSLLPFNRREYLLGNHNITNLSSMKILGRKVEYYGIPVKITMNSHYYLARQYDEVVEHIRRLMDIGFNTFILADLSFVLYLREQGVDCQIHISGEVETYNRETVQFVNQAKVSRIVFPRKINLGNIRSVIEGSGIADMEYEAFFLNAFCLYSGAFCNGTHCDEMSPVCEIPMVPGRFEDNGRFKRAESYLHKMTGIQNKLHSREAEQSKPASAGHEVGNWGCGMCRIKELESIGVTHLKVVGRGGALENLAEDIRIAKSALQMNTEQPERQEAEIRQELGYRCSYLCYYPSGLPHEDNETRPESVTSK
ncbi:U32 family peptidase [Paenibacillus sp. FSL H3-0333]|uniref:U32 family peptidase n=1 Tax=Paenibacillus sp. FSL H3-0333 TaxID=2921373 RepID=UPI0030FB301A